MPVMPDCHGSEYSRLGSHVGCICTSSRFFMFGIDGFSIFSSQPSLIIRPGKPDESVMTMMSRPIDCPRASGPWIFPKNDGLSLMSSVYLTLTPVFFVKASRVGCCLVFSLTSMYNGQFEKFSVDASLRVTSVVVSVFAPDLMPLPPPHAASRPGIVSTDAPTAPRSSSCRLV